jgi:hypothetical protein
MGLSTVRRKAIRPGWFFGVRNIRVAELRRLLPKQLLPLPDHAQVAVIHHDDLDRQPCSATVASSGIDIWNPPSLPREHQLIRLGNASRWPTAAEAHRAEPAELIHKRGWLNRINCAAHLVLADVEVDRWPRRCDCFRHQVLWQSLYPK